MKNKGKKIYFTIFTLFLAVTVMITSSITLAFFGDTSTNSAIVKLSNALEVDSFITITSPSMYVSPSQTIKVEATATVKSPGDGQTTDGLLRAKVDLITDAVSLNVAVVAKSTFDGDNIYWKYNNGYYYLVTEEGGNNLYTVTTTTAGVDVPMEISIIIPKTLTNADGGQEFKVSVTFCTIQARIFNSTGVDLINNTIENTRPIFNQVEGNTVPGEALKKIKGNSVQNATPTPNSPAEIKSVGDKTKNLFDRDTAGNISTWPSISYKYYPIYVGSGKKITVSYEGDLELGLGFYLVIGYSEEHKGVAKGDWLYHSTAEHLIKNSVTFTTQGDYVYINTAGTNANAEQYILNCNFQIEESSIATSYEPYGYKIPVSVDTETYYIYLDEPLRKVGNYADYIDFETGKIVRNIKTYQITKDTSFNKFANVTDYSAFYVDMSADMIKYSAHNNVNLPILSKQLNYHACSGANTNSFWAGDYQIGGSLASTYTRICFTLPNTIADVAAAKLWLEDNPIDVYYPLATSVSADIDLSHIPYSSGSIYGVSTEIQPEIIVEIQP